LELYVLLKLVQDNRHAVIVGYSYIQISLQKTSILF